MRISLTDLDQWQALDSVTGVIIEDIPEGQWGVGGPFQTADDVRGFANTEIGKRPGLGTLTTKPYGL